VFLVKPKLKKNGRGKLCSNECRFVWQSWQGGGERSPSWKGGPETAQCGWCGKDFMRARNGKKPARFCSSECNSGWRSHRYSGENNPSYCGGKQPYPSNWNRRLKKQIRERDGFKCVLCGKAEIDEGINLAVHHVDYDKNNLDPENLIALCHACHIKTNSYREHWPFVFVKLPQCGFQLRGVFM